MGTRYAPILNRISRHLEHEQNKFKRRILRDIARELRHESRYEPMATENYYLTIIGHAERLMGVNE